MKLTEGTMNKDDQIRRLRAQVAHLNEQNRKRNLQLDMLNFVWCNGGCDAGLRRWSEKHTEDELLELTIEAELYVKRLKTYVNNYVHKNNSHSIAEF